MTGEHPELDRLVGFVRARYEEVTRAGDGLTQRWAQSNIEILEAMETHLRIVPASAYELRRFLLRTAGLHPEHAAYRSYWTLDVPEPRRPRAEESGTS